MVDQARSKFAGKVDFEKVDVDNPANKQLRAKYGVTGAGAFVFLDSQAEVVNTMPAKTDPEQFMNAVRQLVGR